MVLIMGKYNITADLTIEIYKFDNHNYWYLYSRNREIYYKGGPYFWRSGTVVFQELAGESCSG